MILSIIIISKDNIEQLHNTIKSCSSFLNDNDCEFVFVDSSSAKEQVRNLILDACRPSNNIRYTYQEPVGIYKAMNQGVNQSSGNFIWFVNAGDEINPQIASRNIKYNLKSLETVLYSTRYCWAHFYSPTLFSFPSHQEIIYPRNFAVENPFEASNYPIAADMVHKILLCKSGRFNFIRSKDYLTMPQSFGVSANFTDFDTIHKRQKELKRLINNYIFFSAGWLYIAILSFKKFGMKWK